MNELKKAAEILVECGYADAINEKRPMTVRRNLPIGEDYYPLQVECDPFADTLEGHRQANAIEDWLFDDSSPELYKRHYNLWHESSDLSVTKSRHQWRLDRIKWCLEQLAEES
jgi:hypothetical protein